MRATYRDGWNLTMYEKGDPRNAQKGATIPLTYNVADVLGIDLPRDNWTTGAEYRAKNAFKALKTYADKFYNAINS